MASRKSVMISSTARDLPLHREQVRLACERAGLAPHDMMEHLTALNTDAIAASLAMVENADVYVGVFAFRYGCIPDGHDRSITEMEYDRAIELKKPCLIFFAHEDHPFTVKDVETGPGAAKLQALKERIGKARVAAFFRSPEDLRAHVVEALSAFNREVNEAGPQGASQRALVELHRKTSIPQAPAPYVAHPYTLLQTREFVGRRAELNLLTDWVTKPGSNARDATIFAIVAIGGMGKSAHAWKWFNEIAPNEIKLLAGRLWWSFYESDATFENFVNRALCYVSDTNEQEVRKLTWQDREALLLKHLNTKPYLFVLDGLERVMIAYNRLDASIMLDDDCEPLTVDGASGATPAGATAISASSQHRLRQTTDPRAGALLQKIALVRESRLLITSRLFPSELELPNGGPRPGCFAYSLGGLCDDDALGLWRSLGASGSKAELMPIFNSVQNHPMLVQALAGEVANYRKAPGDFATWREDHPHFDPASMPLVQSRTHILHFALDGLSSQHRAVLHTIVGFRMPVSYSALEALLTGADKLFDDVRSLDLALTTLEDRGLIGWDREANRYDAHPIVRGVVWKLTEHQDKQALMARLNQFFEPIPVPDWREAETIDELAPSIQRYHALIELGRFDEAFDLFCTRLDKATYNRFSAHNARISWFRELIGEDGKTLLSSRNAEQLLLSSLALSYDITGEPGKAISALEELTSSLTEEDPELCATLSDMGNVFIEVGRLAESFIASATALLLCRRDIAYFPEEQVLRELSQYQCTVGNLDAALVSLSRAKKIDEGYVQERDPIFDIFLAQSFLRRNDARQAIGFAERAWNGATRYRFERYSIWAAFLQGAAALALDDLGRADERLHHALVRARGSNVVEFELPIVVKIAELTRKRRSLVKAKDRLDEAWEGILRGPYPLVAADAYNILTEVELGLGNDKAARDAAISAFRAA